MLRPVGPVVVFGASNFPLAISVAGSDTVSALGAGCPVIVKAHPGHPGACELVAGAIKDAVAEAGLPAGVFSLVHGASHDVGRWLVEHPACRAVAFTGSLAGGKALADLAAARPEPIPVYAEMGSVNPMFLMPGALAERAEQIAEQYVLSLNMGVGQFCTQPRRCARGRGAGLRSIQGRGRATRHRNRAGNDAARGDLQRLRPRRRALASRRPGAGRRVERTGRGHGSSPGRLQVLRGRCAVVLKQPRAAGRGLRALRPAGALQRYRRFRTRCRVHGRQPDRNHPRPARRDRDRQRAGRHARAARRPAAV